MARARANEVGTSLGGPAGGEVEPPEGYRVLRRLGDGAEGGAFEAEELASGLRVVLKPVPAGSAKTVAHAFAMLRRSGSPHLPAPHALVRPAEGDRAAWLVTTFVAGRPLTRGPIAPALAVREAAAIAHALSALHRAGTHHGDVSPANVVQGDAGMVTLVDLGQLERRGVGTPGFLAPEVLAGGGGPAADQFALGCLLCWRLWGEVPWSRPEALLRVRTLEDVRARLLALGADTLPRSLQELLVRMLHPNAQARIVRTDELSRRLAQAEAWFEGGSSPEERWWIPRRWPYRGVALDPVLGRWTGADPAPPRLVTVVGPEGSGRARVVEEIVQGLQTLGVAAAIVDPERLGAGWVGWLEAWMVAPAERGVIGLAACPPWPAALADRPELQAATLLAAGALASTTLVLAVSPELGRALAASSDEAVTRGVVQVAPRPWTSRETEAALAEVTSDTADVEAWIEALRQVGGLWPASTVRAIEACARQGVVEPQRAAIEDALASEPEPSGSIDEALAAAILRASWSARPGACDGLPSHLHDGERPLPVAVVAAQRRLSREGVQELARAWLVEEPLTLAAALDAGDAPAVEQALADSKDLRAADPASGALLEWLQTDAATGVQSRARVLAARFALRQGQAATALAVLVHDDPRSRVEAARALQRLGRPEVAWAKLEGLEHPSARGLRWRLRVDRGEAQVAFEECARWSSSARAEAPRDQAAAWLWGGYAALSHREAELAASWLREAIGAVASCEDDDLEAHAIRARAAQLLGNLAHAQGKLREANEAFGAAAVAFARAEESIGGLLVRGSSAALAIPLAEVARGLAQGRATLRGLLAAGHLDALPHAVLNLVQLLVRVDAREEARALADRTSRLLAGASLGDLASARMSRVLADVAAAEARSGAPQRRREVEHAYARAAQALQRASAAREAADAWLCAAAWARRDGRGTVAQLHGAQAKEAALAAGGDPYAEVGVRTDAVWQALSSGDEPGIALALERLRAVAPAEDADEFELRWTTGVAVMAALRVLHPMGDPERTGQARRLLQTLETMMERTPPLDRHRALEVLTHDAEEERPLLQGLLAELEPKARPESRASEDGARTARLLRMYRRFAREERLEALLEQVADAVMDLTQAERGAVVVRRPDGHRFEVTRELSGGSACEFSRSVIERVLEAGEPVMSTDASEDERFDGARSITHLHLRSVLSVPLRFRGQILGAVYVDHRLRRGNFDDADLVVVEEFADLAAMAVAHAQALSDVRAQAEKLERQGRELAELLEAREVEVAELREEVRTAAPAAKVYRGLVGASGAMQRVFRLIDRLGDASVPVVVYGESGTGKELVARAIHDAGNRRSGPFVAENCGAIPETLLESVLFGHAKGAFTGAQQAKVGLFEAANRGTIFLDEVGEMSPGMQTKLLRVLQEGEVRRVGETAARSVDVRVIAASNRDLEAMVQKGSFRQDLYYRIHVVKVELPPLRQRTEDIPALVEHMLARHGGVKLEVSIEARRALAGYHWPGNVRELENEVQRWVALCERKVDRGDLSPAMSGVSPGVDPDDLRIRPRVEHLERELIERALSRTAGNQTRAADLLGLSRFGLQKKLRRLSEAE